jgi:Fe-S cluster assembly iron-binding protein IscA
MGLSTSKITPLRGAFTNRSGAIEAGGTAQAVCSANARRQYLLFQNISDEDIWINFDGTAAVADQPSIKVWSGMTMEWSGSFIPTGAISVIAATIGSKYVCKEA